MLGVRSNLNNKGGPICEFVYNTKYWFLKSGIDLLKKTFANTGGDKFLFDQQSHLLHGHHY